MGCTVNRVAFGVSSIFFTSIVVVKLSKVKKRDCDGDGCGCVRGLKVVTGCVCVCVCSK